VIVDDCSAYQRNVESDFLAHLTKGNVSYCHHLASVVRKLFTF